MEYLDCTAGTNGNFYHLSLVTKEQELKTVRTCDKLYMLMSCWILWNLSNIFITPFSWSSRKYVSLWHIYLQQIWQGPFTGFMTYIFLLLIVSYFQFFRFLKSSFKLSHLYRFNSSQLLFHYITYPAIGLNNQSFTLFPYSLIFVIQKGNYCL